MGVARHDETEKATSFLRRKIGAPWLGEEMFGPPPWLGEDQDPSPR